MKKEQDIDISAHLKKLEKQLKQPMSRESVQEIEGPLLQLEAYVDAQRAAALTHFLATGEEEQHFDYHDLNYHEVKNAKKDFLRKKKEYLATEKEHLAQQHRDRRHILQELRKILNSQVIQSSSWARINALKTTWAELPEPSDGQRTAYEALMQRAQKRQEIVSAFIHLDEGKKEEEKLIQSQALKLTAQQATLRLTYLEALEKLLSDSVPETSSEWQSRSQRVEAMQADWQKLPTSPVFNALDRDCIKKFRKLIKDFYTSKKAYFSAVSQEQLQQLKLRQGLIEEAEHILSAESLDTESFFELQKKWKAAGPVSHQVHKKIHKQWKELQTRFYAQKKDQDGRLVEEAEAQYALYEPLYKSLSTLIKSKQVSLEALSLALDECPEPRLPPHLHTRWTQQCSHQMANLLSHILRQDSAPSLGDLVSLLKAFKRRSGLGSSPKLLSKQKQLKGRTRDLEKEILIYQTNLDRLRSSDPSHPLRTRIVKQIHQQEQQLQHYDQLLRLYEILV